MKGKYTMHIIVIALLSASGLMSAYDVTTKNWKNPVCHYEYYGSGKDFRTVEICK